MKLVGWIGASEEDRETLERFGVKLGPYDPVARTFNDCEADEDAAHEVEVHPFFISGLKHPILTDDERRVRRAMPIVVGPAGYSGEDDEGDGYGWGDEDDDDADDD